MFRTSSTRPSPRSRPPRLRRGLAWIGASALAFALVNAAAAAPASATAVPGPPSGWSTVFSDSFAGGAGSGIDSQWVYDTGQGNWGTNEIENMTNSTNNVHLDGNGHLDITAIGSGANWTSGRVQTSSAVVGAPAGGELEVTASIQQPNNGPGYWPAFWMLGPGQWPENGEIDIMEDVNSLSELSGTVHCGVDPGGPCNEPDGIGSGLVGCSGCQSGYHTYTMILNRTNTADESITFYLDGNQYFSVSESQVGTSTWQAAYDHNLAIILDLAIGGDYPNGVCGCTTPTGATSSGGTMSVQYVAAYETSGGGGTPPPPPPPPSGQWTGQITGYNGLCLDDRAASTALKNPVQVYTCNGTNAQQWTVVESGSTIQDFGMCLDVNSGATTSGTPVDLYTCNGTGAQVWIPESGGTLYNPQSNMCLDDTEYGGSGTQLQIAPCYGNDSAQVWHLPAGAV
jgi:hypothetical protein